MLPSLVKRLSRTLMSRQSATSDKESESSRKQDDATSTSGDAGVTSLRRQLTKQLMSEDKESQSNTKVRGRSSISSIRTSSIVKEVSRTKKTVSATVPLSVSQQLSKRVSKPPSRLVEEDEETSAPRRHITLTKYLKKSSAWSPKKPSSGSSSLSKSPFRQQTLSRNPSVSKSASQTSMSRSGSKGNLSRCGSKTSINRSGSTASINRSTSKSSMCRSGSKGSMIRSGSKGSICRSGSRKGSSTAAGSLSLKEKKKPGSKELWFEAGTYLTVRSEEGGFYLCRAVNNIYNNTKMAKVRWLGLKTSKPKKHCGRRRKVTHAADSSMTDNAFELLYPDLVDPTTVLMEVEVDRKGATYLLKEADRKETERLMQLAQDVESGKMDKGDIGDDVDEAVLIDYEPPIKRHKASKEKKPRLMKTASQKEQDRKKKAEKREVEKVKKNQEKRTRKAAVKEDDTTLKPHPAVKILSKDPLWDTVTYMPYVSKFSNAKLVFRAVQLGDHKMLKKLLKDADRIYWVDHHRCVMLWETPLQFAVKRGDRKAIELLYEDTFGTRFAARLQDSHADKLLLHKLGTGQYNYRSLGVGRIRPLMASRGAREGNNALVKDSYDQTKSQGSSTEDFLEAVLLAGATEDLVMKAMQLSLKAGPSGDIINFRPSNIRKFIETLPVMLARGHNQAAGSVMKVLQKKGQFWKVPSPLWKVLKAKHISEVPSVPPSCMDLHIKALKGFTMIHAAASNPNSDVLAKVLTSDPNFLVSDTKGRRPVHIAAGCSSPAPLQMLLNRGANPYDADTNRETALHYAINAGRTKNVQILLNLLSDSKSRFVDPTAGSPKGGVNYANKKSLSPLHMACQGGHLGIVELLLKHGANKDVRTSMNSLLVTPLMFAAAANHLDIVKCLVDAGAVVELKDRVGRTALMHAAMNGATLVMSYLLHIGADPNRKDTSGNTPLHYAAAYGWYFSTKLLLESGANPAVNNDWTTTPLSVAYLKGHQGVVSILLEDHRVDVNFPNEDGETLLFIACSSDKDEDLVEQIRYLIKEKGADCTLINNKGGTPLHYLADTVIYKEGFYMEEEKKIFTRAEIDEVSSQVLMEICLLLVEGGCDITLRNKEGFTAAMLALKQGNMKLAQYLVERGSTVFTHLAEEEDASPNTLLHLVANRCMNRHCGDPSDVITFLTKTLMVNGEKKSFSKELLEMAQTFDGTGSTPLHIACYQYSIDNFSDAKEHIQRDTWQREAAFSFIKNLVEVAQSDVNVTNRPRWRAFGECQADENKQEDYADNQRSRWTPIFYMLDAVSDPMFTPAHKYIPGSRGHGLKYLLSKGASVNIYDLQGHTPLTYALKCRKELPVVQILIMEGGADVNQCQRERVRHTENGKPVDTTYNVPPICLVAEMHLVELFGELLKNGANVNAVSGQFRSSALHILAEKHKRKSGTLSLMEMMLKAGANLDAQNKDLRTPLHLLVKNGTGCIDDSFEEEILLLSHKASLTVQDSLGRTPLHYTFVKTDVLKDGNTSALDPVHLCKLLVKSMKSADLNIADNAGRTPLHYAAQRNSSICCMYLMQKGANPNVKDNSGNTPLSLAVMARHDSCASVLIQNGAELKIPVVKEMITDNHDNDKEKPPEWKWKPMTMVKTIQEDREVPLFQEAIKHGLVGTSFLILEWPVEKSGITLVDAVEMAVKNSQFNVALRLLSTVMKGSAEVCAKRESNRNMLHLLCLHSAPTGNVQQQVKVAQMLVDKGVSASAKDKHGCTPLLYAALCRNWKLIMFFAGLPGMLDTKYRDGFNRNLLAACLWKCFFTGLNPDFFVQLEQLVKKKVDLNAAFDYPLLVDVFGSKDLRTGTLADPDYWQPYPGCHITPLIFALHCKDFKFTQNLLQWGANPNMTDEQGRTPLMHAVKLNSVKHVKQLLKYDYQPEVDDADPPDAKEKEVKKRKPVKKNVFRLTKRVSDMSEAVSSSSSSSEDEAEEVEKTAIKKTKEYKAITKTSLVNLNTTDKSGWTALHYTACPLVMGTFDNDELVFVLGKAGAKLDAKNADGQTPLDLALAKNAPKVAAMLQVLMGVDKKLQKKPFIMPADRRVNDGILRHKDYNFHSDAEKQLAIGEEEIEAKGPYEPAVSSYCNIANATIVRDEKQDLPYEVLMTRCDAHLGVWGLYNFYQIQLVHQAGKKLYVLFTRWGRIGDKGQFQHTPFTDRDAAIKEFCKIFRAKSGNKWQEVKSFEQKRLKYHLVPVEERRPPKPQKKVEFDFSTSVKCTLPEDVHSAMKIMVNIEMLQNSYQRDIHVDTDVLPFGRFSRDRLLQAQQLLESMSSMVFSIAQFRKNFKNKTPEEKEQHQLDCQKVSELSSDYFQLIPQKNFVYEKLRPLDRKDDFQREFRLITNLLDFETSTKMMLGAMFRKSEIHPLDYVYNVMGCKLQRMEEGDPMTQNILRFALLGALAKKRFEGVYKVEREGEERRFQSCGLDNRRLLWHGTRSCNLVSILNRGLVCMPLDSTQTGQRFGKGIYFSDLMAKSSMYTDSSRDSSSFMLLCEVALGKCQYLNDSSEEEDDDKNSKEDEKYDSAVALGYNFPDPDYDVRLPSGEVMSLGDSQYSSTYETADGRRISRPTNYSEYIVFQEKQVCIRYLLQYRDK